MQVRNVDHRTIGLSPTLKPSPIGEKSWISVQTSKEQKAALRRPRRMRPDRGWFNILKILKPFMYADDKSLYGLALQKKRIQVRNVDHRTIGLSSDNKVQRHRVQRFLRWARLGQGPPRL